jgi:hypothetical protein
VRRAPPANQAGITAIGFLFLAAVFGFLGLAGLKIVPLYLTKMRIDKVLEDIAQELPGQGQNATGIRNEIDARFYIESIQIPRQDVSIRQARNGYEVQVKHEARVQFLGDLWFLVVVDEKIDIPR